MLTVSFLWDEISMSDDCTIGCRIFHIQPVDALGNLSVHGEGHAGCTLVGYVRCSRSSETLQFLWRDRGNHCIISDSIDLPHFTSAGQITDRFLFLDFSAFRSNCGFQCPDDLVESPVEISESFPGYTAIRSDCDAAEKPCGRDFFPLFTEFTSQEGFKKRGVYVRTEIFDDVLVCRNIVESAEICFLCPEGDPGKLCFVDDCKFRIPENLQGCVQGKNPGLCEISCCPPHPF